MDAKVITITNTIKSRLVGKSSTLSVAESCTGGLISHWITSRPGASTFFRSGIIAYARRAKEEILGISGKTIDMCGMISRETAAEMAQKMRLLAKSDYSVASSGNLGPDALEGKETGLVYLAACREGKTVTEELRLKGTREENKEAASLAALELLVALLDEDTERE